MINILLDTQVETETDFSDMIRAAAEAVLKLENVLKNAEISVTVTNDAKIRKMNSEFRGIDRATDVLSFPLYDFTVPAVFDEQQTAIDGGILVLGDIVISLERICEQAQEYGHSVKREFSYMVVHSMLHLLGYDHMTDTDKALMRAHEDAVMEYLDIKR